MSRRKNRNCKNTKKVFQKNQGISQNGQSTQSESSKSPPQSQSDREVLSSDSGDALFSTTGTIVQHRDAPLDIPSEENGGCSKSENLVSASSSKSQENRRNGRGVPSSLQSGDQSGGVQTDEERPIRSLSREQTSTESQKDCEGVLTTPERQFETFLHLTFQPGEVTWLKHSHNRFFRGIVGEQGLESLYHTTGTGENRQLGGKIPNPYEYLEQLCQAQDGGLFFISGKPLEKPLKAYCEASDLLSCEMDDGSRDEQWERLQRFSEASGLNCAVIVSSGSKSLHGHLKLDEKIPIELRTRFQRLLALIMRSDPAVISPHQPMRIPGFLRKEKGNYQELVASSTDQYSVEDIWHGFRACFEALGWTFRTSFCEGRWQKLRAVICNKKEVRTDDEKIDAIADILAMPDEDFEFKPANGFNGSLRIDGAIPLEEFLSRKNRETFNQGVSKGGAGRVPEAFKIASNLASVLKSCQAARIPVSGDAYQLLEDFCRRCSPSITEEAPRIWRDAQARANSTYFGADYVQERAFWFKWREAGEPTGGDYVEWAESVGVAVENNSKDADNPSKEDYEEKRKKEQIKRWLESKKFTPTHTIDEKYFKWDMGIEECAIYLIKSGMGTGKTFWLCLQLLLLKGYGAIALGRINTLLLQFASQKADWFYHLREHDAGHLIKDSKSHLALCIDSLPRFSPEDFDDKTIILDEVCSITRQLLSPWLKNKQDEVIYLFEECLKRARTVICLDGDLSDRVADYISNLAPDKKVVKIENIHKPKPFKIKYLKGAIDEKGEEKKGNYSEFLQLIKKSAGQTNRIVDFSKFEEETKTHNIVISSDSRMFCETIERDVREQNPDYEIINVTSKTTPNDEIKAFLKDPDKYILDLSQNTGKPICLIYSPSAESGVDISIEGFFSYHFHFGFCLGADSQTQMIPRIRDPECERYVWIRPYSTVDTEGASYSTRQFELAKRSQIGAEFSELVPSDFDNSFKDRILKCFESEHFNMSIYLDSLEKLERANLRACVLAKLELAGHDIEEIWGNDYKSRREDKKRLTKEVKAEESEQIFNAPDITDIQAESISKSNTSADWEDRCKVTKHFLKKRLPGIETSIFWSIESIQKLLYDKPRLIRQLTRQFYLNHPELAKAKQMRFWEWKLSLNRDYSLYFGNFKSDYQEAKALIKLGVPKLLERVGEEIKADDEGLLEIHNKLKKSKRIKALASIRPGKTPHKTLTKLCKRFGIPYEREQYRVEGDKDRRAYFYRIESMAEFEQYIYDRISERIKKYEEEKALENQPFSNPTQQAESEPLKVEVENEVERLEKQQVEDKKERWEDADKRLKAEFNNKEYALMIRSLIHVSAAWGTKDVELIKATVKKLKEAGDKLVVAFGETIFNMEAQLYTWVSKNCGFDMDKLVFE